MATNPQVQTVGSAVDKAKVLFAVLLVAAGFAVYFFLGKDPNIAGWMQWLALAGLWVCAAGAFLWSTIGKQFIAYCKDTVREVKKVVWPTRKEAMQMTLYVFIFVLIMAIILWLIDMFLQWSIFGKLLGWSA